ncbi:MAG: zinc-binding dehydrogenase [Opitutaceae bacterium]|nr:zinc-binding dehydrogenase [Opitutaceae bacterium]
MKTLAAILVEQRKPLVIDEVELPSLGFGQVLVEVKATRICGSQLGEIDGVKGPDRHLPHLLGHEAGGIVREIGPEVTQVKPGDRVVLHWRPGKGIQARPAAYRWHGETVNAGSITTFQNLTVVSENRLTVISSDISFEMAALLADTLTTGFGTVGRDARLRAGESVLVVGAGGLGLGAIFGASLSGAYPVVAVDIHDNKLEMSRRFGATHTINSRQSPSFINEIKSICPAFDLSIDTTGSPKVIDDAWTLTSAKGRMHLIGVMKHSDALSLNTLALHYGKSLTGSEGGSSLPHEDIPRLARLFQGRGLKPEAMITDRCSLHEINGAIERMRSGAAIHTVIQFS